ncbi:hypothetical protein [Candidatus Thiosymbion oneisti]|uniref:hypothetical protein n=1 Tax=Candidatus Thiosymbion oneisti TaxID=589554 RepID=UPI001061E8AC|nr:hypothetical protein [Candidatus Thiosymbion oneisti]
MKPNTNPQPSSLSLKTDDIAPAIEDAQLLLQHVAEKGIALDEHDISVLVEAKFSYREGTLSAEREQLFWRSLTNVTRAIKPVTIQSLRAIHQSPKRKKYMEGNIDKVASHYRGVAVLSVIILLVVQIYLIIGVTAKTKSRELFEQKEEIRAKIAEVRHLKKLTDQNLEDDHTIKALKVQFKEIEQKEDANYALLTSWNKIWLTLLFKDEFQGKLRGYRETDYETQFAMLEDGIAQQEMSIRSQSEHADNAAQETSVQLKNEPTDSTKQDANNQRERLKTLKETLREKQLEREHDITRNRFFLNTFSSAYVTIALERYLLPLLYGLLGAIFYVLRTLSRELESLTYLPLTEINYRLRILTGALAGLTVSWFFTGNNLSAGLSGFAVSFLTGYNVELLFFLMDKMISQLTSKNSSSEPAPSQSQPADKGSGLKHVTSQSQPVSKGSGSDMPQSQPANKASSSERTPSQSQPASKDSQKS